MSNYTKATNFATKDTLPSGNVGKIVKGTEIDDEFNAIASAISSKADTASPTFTGTPAAPTAASNTNTTQIATTAFVVNERTTAATLTNKTLTSPVINEIIHEGTADDFETTIAFTDPTADRTITFPDKTGTVALNADLPSASALFTSSGTYAIAGSTALTVTATAHGRSVNDVVYLNFTSGTAEDGYFTITAVTTNTFTVTYGSVITTSGNVTGYYSNQGTVAIASADETVAGVSTTRAVTPAGFNAAIAAIAPTVITQQSYATNTTHSISVSGTNRPIMVCMHYSGLQGGTATIGVDFQWGLGSLTNTFDAYPDTGVNFVVDPSNSMTFFVTPTTSTTLQFRVNTVNLGNETFWVAAIQL